MQIRSSSSALPKISSAVFVVRYLNTVECFLRSGYICYSYGSRKISLNFSLTADSSLSKLLYLPLEELTESSECHFFEPE